MGSEQSNSLSCECSQWARGHTHKFFTKHHPNCKYFDPQGDAAEIIEKLLSGIRAWASDEDGVHPELCDAYDMAAIVIGEPTLKSLRGGGVEKRRHADIGNAIRTGGGDTYGDRQTSSRRASESSSNESLIMADRGILEA